MGSNIPCCDVHSLTCIFLEILRLIILHSVALDYSLIYNRSAEVKLVKQQNTYTHFELIECDVKTENVGIRIFVVYRPPPSKKNNFQVSAFLDEFSLLLQSSTAMSEEVIITGDFHLDDPSDQNARNFFFLDILDEQGLCSMWSVRRISGAILLTSL